MWERQEAGGGGAPDAHAASHEDGGSDELDLTGLSGGFQNPYPDPAEFQDVVYFLEDIEMRDGKTLWLDTAKTLGIKYNVASSRMEVVDELGQQYAAFGPNSGLISGGISAGASYVDANPDGHIYLEAELFIESLSRLQFPASVAANASLTAPHGVDPDSPNDGDIWTKTTGQFNQIDGVTEEVLYV